MQGSAYDEGYDAYEDGKDYTENPHEKGSEEAIAWLSGWNDAQDEAESEDEDEDEDVD